MHILMLATSYGSDDGFTVRRFYQHQEYNIADSLAVRFIRMRVAVCAEFNLTGDCMKNTRKRLLLRTVAPATEPISTSEAKLYLRVDHSSDDTLIGDLITAARMYAEQWLKSSLITQTWKISYDDYVDANVELVMGPVASITGVVAVARDGSTQTLDSDIYYMNATRDALILNDVIFAHRVEITYVAGYGAAGDVPKPIKQGMLAHISTMYDERGLGDYSILPSQATSLYAPFRKVLL